VTHIAGMVLSADTEVAGTALAADMEVAGIAGNPPLPSSQKQIHKITKPASSSRLYL